VVAGTIPRHEVEYIRDENVQRCRGPIEHDSDEIDIDPSFEVSSPPSSPSGNREENKSMSPV